jgi:DNA-binding LytR/AlgR family response regulator
MKLRTIIVEDEIHALERMKKLLSSFKEIEIVGEAEDGKTAISLIDDVKPDLAFLDIQLPEFTSFEVLERVKYKPGVIFVTAFDQYAIKAFEENAIDYILKPTSEDRLAKAIVKLKQHQQIFNDNILNVLKDAIHKNEYVERFTVKIGDEILFISSEKVFWFKAEDKYVFLNTYDKQYIYDSTLKELELMLDPKLFCRIHKSVIVAQNKIEKIIKSFAGRYNVRMKNNKKTKFDIGRTYLPDLRDKLKF